MAQIKWTDSQRVAIDTRDRTLLVSAAAGSGKTATLTERIIRSILDDEKPISISEMLIVTFTKAATAELRDKISRAIKKALSADPQNERLAEQLRLLPSAHISTIDSFCGDILRQNCERVGVNPGYRIADEAEAALLGDTILEGLIEQIYRGGLPEVATAQDMSYLAECLTDTRHHSELTALLRSIHSKTKDLKDGVYRIRRLAEEYNPEGFTTVEECRLGARAMELVREYAEHYLKTIELHISENLAVGDAKAKCAARVDVLSNDKRFIEGLLAAKTYEEARETILGVNLEDSKRISIPKDYKDVLPDTTEMRKCMKGELAGLAKIFDYTTDEWRDSFAGQYKVFSTLASVIEAFDGAFRAEKLRLGICEFSDVSRYTYECLWQGEERTDIAYSEMEKYRAIYVDEYQDVNEIQHLIFRAISRPDNLFMVGDIKQSIYGFRGADSSIFASLKEAYPEISTGKSGEASIFMSENFRCDEGIIDFTNAIFDRVFFELRDSIGYKPEERLKFAKSYDGIPKPDYRRPTVTLLPRGSGKKGVILEGDEEYTLEALVVAEKIRDLLDHGKKNDGTAIKPGDIAIIMRSTSSRLASYTAAIEALGVPVATMDTNTFFLNPEILLVMSILNTIDNPEKSIYLAGAMMSPIFGFTADDVVRISRATDGSLYSSLKQYVAEHPDYARGKRLLDFISRYRILAEGMSVDLLISRIYRECSMLSVAEDDSGRECLNRFYEHARQFESSSFKGLYNFIHYVNGIIDKKHSFDSKEANLNPEAVKIITAHSSKGLEFPVVFFSYLSYGLASQDTRSRLVFDAELGMSMRLRSSSGASLIDNPTVAVLKTLINRRAVEEEARVLYVALTRARERLICIGTATKKLESIEADIEAARDIFTPYTVYNMSSYLEMICLAAAPRLVPPEELVPNMPEALINAIYPPDTSEKDFSEPEEAPRATLSEYDIPEDDFEIPDGEGDWFLPDGEAELPESRVDTLIRRFTYRYPREHLTRLPEKLSVSRLYPDILDMNAEEMSLEEIIEKQSHLNMERLPAFAVGHEMTESAKRGIATHLLFQFCDFERLKREGAEAELSRLVAEKFISTDDAARVRLGEVEAFRRSALIDDILGAKRVWCEQRFNVRLPAAMLTLDDELRARFIEEGCEVLVQGVIDCLYESDDGELHLVDYKTDRLSYEERQTPSLAEAKLRSAHAQQLGYYTEAVKRMFGREPSTVEVYSLHLARTVDVKQ